MITPEDSKEYFILVKKEKMNQTEGSYEIELKESRFLIDAVDLLENWEDYNVAEEDLEELL